MKYLRLLSDAVPLAAVLVLISCATHKPQNIQAPSDILSSERNTMKQNFRIPLAAVLCLALMTISACKAKTLPPGAINSFDAYAYDGLSTAKGAIDGFKSKYDGLSPTDQDFVKPYLNQLVADYNGGEAAWQLYHATGTGDTAALSSNLQALVNDIAQITQAFAKKGVK